MNTTLHSTRSWPPTLAHALTRPVLNSTKPTLAHALTRPALNSTKCRSEWKLKGVKGWEDAWKGYCQDEGVDMKGWKWGDEDGRVERRGGDGRGIDEEVEMRGSYEGAERRGRRWGGGDEGVEMRLGAVNNGSWSCRRILLFVVISYSKKDWVPLSWYSDTETASLTMITTHNTVKTSIRYEQWGRVS